MTDEEREERAALQGEFDLCSLRDRPPSMAIHKLRRLIELDAMAASDPDCMGCRYEDDEGCTGNWEPEDGGPCKHWEDGFSTEEGDDD